MIVNRFFITLLLCLISTVAIAEDQHEPGKSVEEIERQRIAAELSYRLDTKLTCKQKLIWSDKGSGAELDGFFFAPSAESSYFIIGGYASGKVDAKSNNCVISVRPSKNNPEESPELLVVPGDWSLIWTDKGSGANTDGSMWNAIPPGKEYKCLGTVMQKGYKKPVLPNYRCVHSGLTRKIQNNSIVWTDKGSGADKDVTVFNLPNSKSFFAVGRKTNKAKTYDLNDTASVEPDAAVVEKLLAQRMKELYKIQAAEKKRLADEYAKKRLAKVAASKRIAEEKRLAEEMAEEAAEEAEQKQEAEEAEQQEMPVVEVEQEEPEQEPEEIQEAEEPKKQLPGQEPVAEVVVVQQPDVKVEINQQQSIEKADKEDSKAGIKILFVFMLLLLIYAAYRVFGIVISIIKGDK
jgi:hypothetical protein